MLDITPNDPSNFDYALFESYGPNGAMVESLLPSIIEDEPYAVDEGYLSDCCRFITLLMSMPPISGGVYELDVNFELKFGPSNGASPRMVVFLDLKLWKTFILKRDLKLEVVPFSSIV